MLRDYKSVLKNKSFVHIWISQIFSQLTISMMNFLLLIRLFEVTGSAISTSFLWVAYALPAILIGPFASGIIDLVDKKKVLVLTNLLQALTIFIYALSFKSSIFLLYEVVFIYSFLNQFYLPSETSLLPTVLDKKKLVHGNSLFLITQQSALVLGFALAGVFNALLGFRITLFLSSAFVFIAFISTLFLPKFEPKKEISKKFDEAVFDFFRHIFEGYNFIKTERKVLTPVLLLLVFQTTVQICIVQFPVMARDLLGISLNSASIFLLAPAGIGAILGALVLPKILKKNVRKKTIIDASLLTMGVAILLLTFFAPLFGYTARVVISFILIVAVGFGFVGILVPSQTFLQESTPDALRGRVFGNFSFLVIAVSVLPVIFSGSIVEVFGIKSLMFILAAIVIAVYAISKKFGNRFLAG
ncbi:MAG: major facilitator superfamily MFS_1 [uncultured bacterium]|nr:MAG: major facilitator superfamily MFS_1 [uncultured bacterium]